MAYIKTLIIDDELLARNRVKRFLKTHTDFEVVGEAANGAEALTRMKLLKPDLLFLDIQMPDMNGFDVLEQMTQNQFPLIVFVTAFSNFALKAFDFYALDYLVKPFDQNRFNKCIEQVVLRFKQKEHSSLNQKIMSLLLDRQKETYLTELKVKENSVWLSIPVTEINLIESYGNYLKIHTVDGVHLYRSTMNELVDQLDSNRFIRIHRSLLINRAFIKKISYQKNNEYRIDLNNNKHVKSGRHYRDQVEKLLIN